MKGQLQTNPTDVEMRKLGEYDVCEENMIYRWISVAYLSDVHNAS